MASIERMQERGSAHVARPQMVWLDGGEFWMGSDNHYPEEAPSRRTAVSGFWIDVHPVTNRQFAQFVKETGWVTVAEIAPDPADYPGALPDMLAPSSLVFQPTRGPVPLDEVSAWWRYTPDADWRHPTGPQSGLAGLWDHPVVHVAWADVEAYAGWAGKELPTEAEWEFACRGGLDRAEFAWGAEIMPGGQIMANTWRGRFPYESLKPPGAFRTSRVGLFVPNGYGLCDMIGNVWEWTRDWWSQPMPPTSPCCTPHNPVGGSREGSVDPATPAIPIPRKVLKGGSHLCAPSYCRRYRPAARHAHPIDTSTSHVGFRCVARGEAPA
jgi:formylglycine-generating enzyme required for sulfatase activity